MNEPQKLKLCSDLNSSGYRIFYQHYDHETNEPVGPTFANKERAAEWYGKWLAAQYYGEERRESAVDRRRHDKRRAFEQRSEGRRLADKPVEFEDRVSWMLRDLAKMRSANQSNEY